jgi:hypothetical protein
VHSINPQGLSRAVVLASAQQRLEPGAVGRLGSLERLRLGRRPHLLFRPAAGACPVTTIVLATPDKASSEEALAAARGALRLLARIRGRPLPVM